MPPDPVMLPTARNGRPAWCPVPDSRHVSVALALVGALAVSGCQCRGPGLNQTLPPDVRVDTYSQQAASKIDVLWIIDDSGSMAPRQEILARNLQAFINEFTKNAIDYRIAVTTTDIFKEAGHFVGSPTILSPQTPSVINAFANNVRVGSMGSPFEIGMEAARLAIENQKTANAQQLAQCQQACPASQPTCPSDCAKNALYPFLRTDAYLYLIFVSDEDDKSSQDVRFFYRYFETIKGIGNDGTVTTAAIMGDVPSNTCGATPGVKYQALSDLTGGEVGSICDPDFSVTLKKLATNAVGLKRKFALQLLPNLSTLKVTLRYPCNVAADVTAPCASVDNTACAGNAPDALDLVCTPKMGSPDGWSYETANNDVYFEGDSVPGLSAEIDLQYYEQGKGP